MAPVMTGRAVRSSGQGRRIRVVPARLMRMHVSNPRDLACTLLRIHVNPRDRARPLQPVFCIARPAPEKALTAAICPMAAASSGRLLISKTTIGVRFSQPQCTKIWQFSDMTSISETFRTFVQKKQVFKEKWL